MKKYLQITSVVITEIGPIVVNRIKKIKYRLIQFADLSDESIAYTLCVMNAHKNAQRFERLPVGSKLSKVVVYRDKGKNYVDGNSNFSIIKAQSLF